MTDDGSCIAGADVDGVKLLAVDEVSSLVGKFVGAIGGGGLIQSLHLTPSTKYG